MDKKEPVYLVVNDGIWDLLIVKFTAEGNKVRVESDIETSVSSRALYGLLYATIYHLMSDEKRRGELHPLLAEEMQAIYRLLETMSRED